VTIREYKVTRGGENLVQKAAMAIETDSTVDDIVGIEVTRDELSQRRGPNVERTFSLGSPTIMAGPSITAQDQLSGDWLTIDIGDEITIQVVS
jgi:hypothetical protein